MVLRVEKKLFVIEHLISPALPIDSTAQVLAQWNAVYDAHNEVSCLMLGIMAIQGGRIQKANKKSFNAKGKENCLLTLLELIKKREEVSSYCPSFQDYALETATHILNMVPTKKALVKRDTPDKLQQRSVKCIFIGYLKEMMGYYFYFPPENKIVVARYAEFLEKNLISQEVSGRAKELEEIQDNDTSPSEDTSEIPIEV
ncbi:hypothetical protein Tco_0832827 [Tanacetum coccineum]